MRGLNVVLVFVGTVQLCLSSAPHRVARRTTSATAGLTSLELEAAEVDGGMFAEKRHGVGETFDDTDLDVESLESGSFSLVREGGQLVQAENPEAAADVDIDPRSGDALDEHRRQDALDADVAQGLEGRCGEEDAGTLVKADVAVSENKRERRQSDAVERTDVSVKGVRFTDLDLDPEDLGGPVTWEPPTGVADVAGYAVYLAVDARGRGRTQIGGTVPVGTNHAMIPANTPARSPGNEAYSTILVYVKTASNEQS